MKRIALFAAAALLLLGCKQKQETPAPVQEPEGSVVYMTKEIRTSTRHSVCRQKAAWP